MSAATRSHRVLAASLASACPMALDAQRMPGRLLGTIVGLGTLILSAACAPRPPVASASETNLTTDTTPLPPPQTVGRLSLEEALEQRRSVREFSGDFVSDAELSQLLWAAQGITDPGGYRTAPSAGALYPLELYAVTRAGAFHYDPHRHELQRVAEDDLRPELYSAALEQESVLEAPLVVVITAVYARTQCKYGADRGERYVHMEAGHAAQNLLLQAVALGLGAVPIGAFDDAQIQQALGLPSDHVPLYLIPVGYPG